jgi:hypothetical protein
MSSLMRVLVVTHGFPPVSHSGVFRTTAFVKHLPKFGIEPVVFTASDPGEGIPEARRYFSSFDTGLKSTCVIREHWGHQQPMFKNPLRECHLRPQPGA